MAKFLNKKEQVIDFQLTPYGKHRLSVGQLKPAFYSFFDTGVTYDVEYANFKENQNNIHERIKTETHFIEGVLLFEEAENSVPPSSFIGGADVAAVIAEQLSVLGGAGSSDGAGQSATSAPSADTGPATGTGAIRGGLGTGTGAFSGGGARVEDPTREDDPAVSLFDLDIHPQMYLPKPEILSFESSIGDAKFEGDNTQAAPAWKIVSCQGEMSNIRVKDTTDYNFTESDSDQELTEFNVPQIDVNAYYTLLISSDSEILEEETISDFISETRPFAGGNTIKLVRDDIMIYGEEVNTELLTENFDIEVFEIVNEGVSDSISVTSTAGTQLKRKYFKNVNPQIIDGLMVAETPQQVSQPTLTTDSVEYFFDILTDSQANGKIACSCANAFNKNSYYVDIDFDCVEEEFNEIYYDIYGSATSPEICDLPPTTVQDLMALQPTEDDCEDI